MAEMIGRQLGKYTIVDHVGEGGMASVYKGYDESIDRHVAIKVLVTDANTDSSRAKEMIERFQLEARTIARLQHPHILPIHEYGVEGNILYLVMPYMAGGTLKDRINADDGMMLGEVSDVLKQVAAAMDYAHRQDIIHRDIKPSNILMDDEGHALIADFGLVKIMTGDSALTETGLMVGTPAYLAPEYASGEDISRKTDIYALGVSMFEAIIGVPPYGDTKTQSPMQIALQHVMEPVPKISTFVETIPETMDEVFLKVLAKDPAERYATASDFAAAFEAAMQDHDTSVYHLPHPEPQPQAPTAAAPTAVQPGGGSSTSITIQLDNRGGLWVAAAAVILVLGVLAAFLFAGNMSSNTVETPAAVAEDAPVTTLPALAGIDSIPTATVSQLGQASFTTTGGLGDTLSLQVNGLRDAPDDTHYYVWLINTGSGDTLAVGRLGLDGMGNGSVTYNHPNGVFLPAVFNAVIITAETDASDTPTGETLYHGSIPETVSQALFNILLSSDEGIQERGLLASAIAEAYLAREQTQSDAQFTSMGSVLTLSEQTINALFGAENDYNGDGRADNPGFGKGLIPVLDALEGELDVMIGISDDLPRIQSNVEYIRTCISNTRTRVDHIAELQQTVVAAEDVDAISGEINEVVDTLDVLLKGMDMNENGRVEGFSGECGLEQIASFTLLVSAMELQEGVLPQEDLIAFYQPYAFDPERDFCIDDELTIGIARNTDEHEGMGMGSDT